MPLQGASQGSTSVTSDINGALGDTVKYSAFGEVRAGGTATDYLYTSQRNETEFGLDFYVSRFYDPVIGHFIQPDTIVPEAGSSKAYDRYGYVNNNPVRCNDPSGHAQTCADGDEGGGCGTGSTKRTYLGALKSWFDNVTVINSERWSSKQLSTLIHGLLLASSIHGGTDGFKQDVGDFTVIRTNIKNISGMAIPIPKNPIMLLNKDYLNSGNRDSMETILHETAHVFDYNGPSYKSTSFVPFFSPGSSCSQTIVGCLNSNTASYPETIRNYANINAVFSGTSNFGYSPTKGGTTSYGEIGTLDDWAETYMVMGLDLAGEQLTQEQQQVWDSRKLIIWMYIGK